MTGLGLQPDQKDKYLNQPWKGFQLDADQMTPSAFSFVRIHQSGEKRRGNLKAGLGDPGFWHFLCRIMLDYAA